jgi:hypothetical protein
MSFFHSLSYLVSGGLLAAGIVCIKNAYDAHELLRHSPITKFNDLYDIGDGCKDVSFDLIKKYNKYHIVLNDNTVGVVIAENQCIELNNLKEHTVYVARGTINNSLIVPTFFPTNIYSNNSVKLLHHLTRRNYNIYSAFAGGLIASGGLLYSITANNKRKYDKKMCEVRADMFKRDL